MRGLRRLVGKAAARIADDAVRLSDAIWEFAEEPFREFKSASAIREFLGGRGFRLTKSFPMIPTAFEMRFGSGRPRIGLLAEYDALPDCGIEMGAWGHGCGHNLLGAASAMAAAIVAEAIGRGMVPSGSVVLAGCPAEESLAGKAYMARDGAFRGLDAVLAWHPSSENRVNPLGGAALDSVVFEFFGRTAHGASAHLGRSALDAALLMEHAVNILREHVPENVRIHSVITGGGTMPNVVPAYARLWYYVRGRDRKEVDGVSRRVTACARGAALATETRAKRTLLTAIYARLPNDTLADMLRSCMEEIGPPEFDSRDASELKKLGLKGEFARGIERDDKKQGRASSDEDTVSWLAPLGRFSLACFAEGPPGHHRDTTAQGRARFAHKGMLKAGQILAFAALRLMTDRNLLIKARDEFRRRTRGFRFDPLVPKGQIPPIRDRIPSAVPRPDGPPAEGR
ncbi:MAG: amidohydrolase [Planctomycetota bacterium]|nr:amidohydrolase [Planctomycetota bacterium]